MILPLSSDFCSTAAPPSHSGISALSHSGLKVSVKYNIDLRKKAADEIIASVEYRTVYGSRGKYTRESETV